MTWRFGLDEAASADAGEHIGLGCLDLVQGGQGAQNTPRVTTASLVKAVKLTGDKIVEGISHGSRISGCCCCTYNLSFLPYARVCHIHTPLMRIIKK